MEEEKLYVQMIKEYKTDGRLKEMHLKEYPFNSILSGRKTYELRLNDEKRSQLHENDIIRFTVLGCNEKDVKVDSFYALVKKLKYYNSFDALYTAAESSTDEITLYRCGNDEYISREDFLNRMEEYYSKEEQDKYGVVAIQLEVIK